MQSEHCSFIWNWKIWSEFFMHLHNFLNLKSKFDDKHEQRDGNLEDMLCGLGRHNRVKKHLGKKKKMICLSQINEKIIGSDTILFFFLYVSRDWKKQTKPPWPWGMPLSAVYCSTSFRLGTSRHLYLAGLRR